jgi:predicted nuclease of predicted toxin-antitoxin system
VKLPVDMNIPPLMVPALNATGHDAVHWMDVGPPSATDSTIMAWASDNRVVLLTHDLDFGKMLAASGSRGPSVIPVREERLAVEPMCRLIAASLGEYGQELQLGAVLTLGAARNRVRLLPINRPTGFGPGQDAED